VDRKQLSQTSLSELRGFRPYHEVNVALQELQQRHELIERLLVIGLIQQPIELSRRCTQPPNDLPLGKRVIALPSNKDPLKEC
jgi:hypothetical protein